MTAALRSNRLRRGGQTLIQALVVTLGWAGFFWMWMLVARRPWEFDRLVWLIGGSIVVLPLVTFAWVVHNRALYRRKGERRGVSRAVPAYTHDWHGRGVDADWPALRQSELITISLAGNRKRYHGRTRVAPHAGRGIELATPPDMRPPSHRPVVSASGPRAAHDLLTAGADHQAT